MKQDADLVAWSLQFLVGLFVGSLFGFALGSGRGGHWWISDPAAAIAIICGSALFCAGQASLRGDRLWYGNSSSWEFPADRMRHSRNSRAASILASVCGAVGIVGAFVWHWCIK